MMLVKQQMRVQTVALVLEEDGMKSGLLPQDYFLAPYYLLLFYLCCLYVHLLDYIGLDKLLNYSLVKQVGLTIRSNRQASSPAKIAAPFSLALVQLQQ